MAGAHHTSFHCMWLELSPSTVHILEVSGLSFALVYFVDTSGHVLMHSILLSKKKNWLYHLIKFLMIEFEIWDSIFVYIKNWLAFWSDDKEHNS